jgi:hypothetical protein
MRYTNLYERVRPASVDFGAGPDARVIHTVNTPLGCGIAPSRLLPDMSGSRYLHKAFRAENRLHER